MKKISYFLTATVVLVFTSLIFNLGTVTAQTFPVTVTDKTPTAPLANPVPSSFQPRYISGFGSGNSFTVFFEDRDNGNKISYTSTTTGPTGFTAAATTTNISDTHFCIKDWPITISATTYAYRAWGSVGNNMQHHFYVSNDLTNWTLVSTFTIPNAAGFTDSHGWVYYGFHDVIKLNGTYYAFAESNQSQTMLVRSANGDDVWEAFASIGGRPGWGPLELPSGVSFGWTPSGSFVDLGHDRGYGKVHVDPRDSHFYLAINTAARTSLAPAALEAAFINPANWTWHDGTTGPASTPILSETSEHDLRECWVVPNSAPDADWVIIYDADFGSADGGKALGYTTLSPPLPPPNEVWVDDDWNNQSDVDSYNSSLTWQHDAFNKLQDGIDAVPSGTASKRSIVHVLNGTYGITGQSNTAACQGYSFPTAILIKDLDYLTIQAAPGQNPVVKPVTTVEADIVSISIENSDHLIIDNIDSDQTVAQFDNWHVCSSNDLTVRNSTFKGGEDGIDFNTSFTTALIENNTFKNINTGSGDEVLDFTDASYSDVLIQDNTFENNYRQITLNELSGKTISDFTIRRNVMDGTNSQEAIRLIRASDILIENNVIMNNLQQGVYIDNGCGNITIRHNSFFNNDQEFTGNGEVRTKVTTSDIVIKNNIFYANGSNPVFETTVSSLPGEDYNLVYNYSGSFTYGANTITAQDPLFVSTTGGSEDLHLQNSSPAIAAGTDLGVSDDIEKNSRPRPASTDPDLGAYESTKPTPAGPECGDFVFLVDNRIKISKQSPSAGAIHSNGEIDFKKGAPSQHTGDLSAVEKIDIAKRNEIVGTATAPEIENDGSITTPVIGVVAPVALPVVSFSAGGDKISVPKYDVLSLATGSYGSVKVNRGATLKLSQGEYFMKKLNVDKAATLEIDVSGGEVVVNVEGLISFGKKMEVVITPGGEDATDQVTFNSLNKGSLKIQKEAKVLGSIVAPKAKVSIDKNARFKGSICAKDISVKKGVVYLPHGSSKSLPKMMPIVENMVAEDVQLTSVPTEYELGQNYPNPFNPSTTITFSVPHAGDVGLSIYNLRGQLVQTLVSGAMAAGRHNVVWDGRDSHGLRVSSGIYVYRLTAKDFVATRKLAITK